MAVLAPIMPALMVASSVMGAVGSIQQGMAGQAAGNAAAQQARDRAVINRQLGGIAADRTRREGEAFAGRQQVAFAAHGVDLSSGTPIGTLADTASEYDWRAQSRQWEYETQAVDQENRASLSEFEGRQAMWKGVFGAFQSLASGASKAYDMRGASPDSPLRSAESGSSGGSPLYYRGNGRLYPEIP